MTFEGSRGSRMPAPLKKCNAAMRADGGVDRRFAVQSGLLVPAQDGNAGSASRTADAAAMRSANRSRVRSFRRRWARACGRRGVEVLKVPKVDRFDAAATIWPLIERRACNRRRGRAIETAPACRRPLRWPRDAQRTQRQTL
ncbi:hypothetical protein KDW36_03025 [Burkholderia dolosa]|uniref:hypothetical protein n=1 Tax=Burkholderia dolosa TaxID=152500 RepID=UPI001BA371D3|nr:hypothetical protein [Burkholderia dolosa]MBR8312169.1 hypothetical protein [Burkholderia dolosa]